MARAQMVEIAARLDEAMKEDPSSPTASLPALSDDPEVFTILQKFLKKNGWRLVAVEKARWWIHTNDCICNNNGTCVLALFE